MLPNRVSGLGFCSGQRFLLLRRRTPMLVVLFALLIVSSLASSCLTSASGR